MKTELKNAIKSAYDDITHTTDGQLDQFVAINRAIQLARSNKYLPIGVDDPIANALDQFLFGYYGDD